MSPEAEEVKFCSWKSCFAAATGLFMTLQRAASELKAQKKIA
jgi:hypothetical protein